MRPKRILLEVVYSKNAAIETLKYRIERLQTKTVEAVHARHKELVEELGELDTQKNSYGTGAARVSL